MKNSYKEFSQIYDLLMDIDYEKWTSFIMKKLEGKRKILEAACGTGGITTVSYTHLDVYKRQELTNLLEFMEEEE